MGLGKPNDQHNPPFPLNDHGNFAFPTRENGAADCGQISLGLNCSEIPFPYMSLPNFPWDNMHTSHQSYPHDPQTSNHLMTGLMRPNTSQSLQFDPSLSNLRGSLRDANVCSSGFQNNEVHGQFIPSGSKVAGGYQMNGQGGEAESTNMHWSHNRGSSLSVGHDTSMSHHNANFLEAGVSNDIKFNSSHPRKVDGSFLTLGIGDNPETRAKTKFDPREIVSRLAEAVGPQSSGSRIQPATNLCHNLTDNFSSFQSNPGCFPSKLGGFGGWTFSHNDGSMQGATVGMSSNAYLNPYVPGVLKQHEFFENNDKNSSFMDKSIGRHSAQESYKCSQGNPYSSSLPFNSGFPCFPRPGFTNQAVLASETGEPTWISTQPTRDLLWNSHSMNPGNVSSSFGSHSTSHRGSPFTHDYLGQLSSGHWVNSTQAFGSSNFPSKTDIQIAEGSAKKPAMGAPFPRRLGVQIDDAAATQSAVGSVFPMNMGIQTRSTEHQSRNSVPVQLTENLVGPISGQPQNAVPSQIPKEVTRSDHMTGQVLANPRGGRVSHGYGVIGQPSVKRKANEPPPVASWGQRRKLVTNHHSAMGYPTTLPSSTPASPHIRWTGFDSPPRPTGQRCMLCKRDLSFTPEGPVYQPSVPPAVAVLPCRHTFHDLCLQNITPEDQSKDPPCIPCAIGET